MSFATVIALIALGVAVTALGVAIIALGATRTTRETTKTPPPSPSPWATRGRKPTHGFDFEDVGRNE